jgi:hypothetical protein
MMGLLLLRQMYDQSDEEVVERWVENPNWQQFCGMSDFQWKLPCDPSDRVYFRQRIGDYGVALIVAVSAQMHGERAKESEVVVGVSLRRRYRKEVRACMMAQRLRKDPRFRGDQLTLMLAAAAWNFRKWIGALGI